MKTNLLIGTMAFLVFGCSGNEALTAEIDKNISVGMMEPEQQQGQGSEAEEEGEEQQEEVESSARYRLTFTSLWNRRDHISVPGNAHFSPVVFTVHNDDHDLLPIGERAGKGLERVAEVGNPSRINDEISSDKNSGSVLSTLNTENQFVPRTPTQTFTFEVTTDHSMVSFVTMIAPSPDWVVGLDGLSLHDGKKFIKSTGEIDLYAYNAGTEDGDRGGNYSIDNSATRNPTPIERLRGRGFDAPFAKVKIEKL